MSNQSRTEFKKAILQDDTETVGKLLTEDKASFDGACFNWNMPAIAACKSSAMVDLIVKHGASPDSVSEWWAPGFGASEVAPHVARYLIELGAKASVHAAAAIGLDEHLAELLADDPELVHAPGGDGCQPLHFARTIEVAKLLLARGADLDARDEDHGSTPVQWRIKESPDVVRYLLDQGATPDIFLAAKLGDLDLAKEILEHDAAAPTYRIGNNRGPFPGIGHEGRGGTIYQWTLGFNLSPHEIALGKGHQAFYDFLFEKTPSVAQLLVACTSANRRVADSIIVKHPNVVSQLDSEDKTLLAKFCWETNINIEAVRLMLDLGFPINIPESNHGYMALHNAAWCGDPELVQLLIDHGHPLEERDPEYKANAIGFAIHSCLHAKRHPDGKFPDVIRLLATAGVPIDDTHRRCGDLEIEAILSRF